jgi:hypothetical protein
MGGVVPEARSGGTVPEARSGVVAGTRFGGMVAVVTGGSNAGRFALHAHAGNGQPGDRG